MEIRKANLLDIPKLKAFFIKAYGESTIFQDDFFLIYYFNLKENSQSIIAITETEEIVSHYGGLQYEIIINQKISPIVWGVNAYTLSDYRGKGINNLIVDYILKNNQTNGVIGFKKKTGFFYEKLNYNLFDYNRFIRYLFIIDYDKSLEIKKFVKSESGELKNDKIKLIDLKSYDNQLVILDTNNIDNYNISLHKNSQIKLTSYRSIDFLKRRFLQYPYIKYNLLGYKSDKSNEITSYLVYKIEKLVPFEYCYFKIIDLFGDNFGISILLEKAKQLSILNDCIYIDFAMFGIQYNDILKEKGFSFFKDDEYSVLPFLCNPIENRENREFVGIQTQIDMNQITYKDIYFTRLDSDRDRLANIQQAIIKN